MNSWYVIKDEYPYILQVRSDNMGSFYAFNWLEEEFGAQGKDWKFYSIFQTPISDFFCLKNKDDYFRFKLKFG